MAKTRQQLIDSGKIYQVYTEADSDTILFEGTRAKCMAWIKIVCWRDYKKGIIRLGKLIWENDRTIRTSKII